MNRTKIEYLDYTWNPIVGCKGTGCAVKENCWARGQAKRRKRECTACYMFSPHYHYERFNQPLLVKKPSGIGVGFMGDLFDSDFGIVIKNEIFHVMEKAPQHRFLCLTKQSGNMVTFNENWQSFPHNVWMGVTVNCRADLYRMDDLRKTDASLKFVSFEPLYEELGEIDLKGIGWAIIGAQTRPKHLPPFMAIGNLIKQLDNNKIPVFLKKNLDALGWKGYKAFPSTLPRKG